MPSSQSDDLFRMGTWNVHSLKGKEQELIEEMKRYDLGVLGVSETRQKGSDTKSIDDYYVMLLDASAGRVRAGV